MTEKEKLIRKLDFYLSKFVRLRDVGENGNFRCISCGRVLSYEWMDCGHYIPRANMATRFNERNCNGQCFKCNRLQDGMSREYRKGMLEKYGIDEVAKLESLKNTTRQWENFELEELIEHYKKAVKALRKKKPLVRI